MFVDDAADAEATPSPAQPLNAAFDRAAASIGPEGGVRGGNHVTSYWAAAEALDFSRSGRRVGHQDSCTEVMIECVHRLP